MIERPIGVFQEMLEGAFQLVGHYAPPIEGGVREYGRKNTPLVLGVSRLESEASRCRRYCKRSDLRGSARPTELKVAQVQASGKKGR